MPNITLFKTNMMRIHTKTTRWRHDRVPGKRLFCPKISLELNQLEVLGCEPVWGVLPCGLCRELSSGVWAEPSNWQGVWGSVMSSPSGVWGLAPAANGFWWVSKAFSCILKQWTEGNKLTIYLRFDQCTVDTACESRVAFEFEM